MCARHSPRSSPAVAVAARASACERFDAYVGELERVLRQHHRVSSRLERVNGALDALREDASASDRVRLTLHTWHITATYPVHLPSTLNQLF